MPRLFAFTTIIAAFLTTSFTTIEAQQPSRSGDIIVRGHWIVNVVHHDGSVVSTTEFENAYQPSELIPRMLVDGLLIKSWIVIARADNWEWTLTWPPTPGGSVDVLAPSSPFAPDSNTIGLLGTGKNLGTVPVRLLNVSVAAIACAPADTPPAASCIQRAVSLRDLTVPEPPSTTVPPPIVIRPNQSIQVKVVYSFS